MGQVGNIYNLDIMNDIYTKKAQMRAASRDGRFQDAISVSDEILAAAPDDFDAVMTKAQIWSIPDPTWCNYDAAIALVDEARRRHPDDLRFLIGLASIQKNAGNYDHAARWYREALQGDEKNYDALTGLASLEEYPGADVSSADARQILEKARNVAPERWQAYAMLAQHLQRSGDKAAARVNYEAAIRRVDAQDARMREELEQEMRALT